MDTQTAPLPLAEGVGLDKCWQALDFVQWLIKLGIFNHEVTDIKAQQVNTVENKNLTYCSI